MRSVSQPGAAGASLRIRSTVPAALVVGTLLVGSAACAPEEEPTGQGQGPAERTVETASPSLPPLPPLPDGPLFADSTAESGLDFVHFNGMAGAFYMPENLGSGGALLDYDGDGDLDVYLVQGREIGPDARIEGATVRPHHPLPLTDRLYRNDLESGEDGGLPTLRFTDVTERADLLEALYGMGAAAGDYDGDGRTDLYVTGFGPNRLLRNVTPPGGPPAFEDVTAAAGVDDLRWSVPAAFFDYDRDGWLDLYVGNYLDYTFETHRPCTTRAGAPDYCDPSAYPGVGDRLFRNLGPGSGEGPAGVAFEDVTDAAGLGGSPGKALGAVAFDADGDGWLDLYVGNDGTPNHLWMNPGVEGGRFEDMALLAGCAVNDEGLAEASMGVDAADVDLDGDPDLAMGHFAEETNTLFLNDGAGMFEDRSVPSGLAAPSLEANGFGTGWLDFDSDGLLDLLVVNGTVRAIPALVRAGDPYPYHQPNQLFRNLGPSASGDAGGVRFEEVTERAGESFERSAVSRGALLGDLDDEGDTDVVVSNSAGPARVLRNVGADGRRWLGVRALRPAAGKGTSAWVDALGARVGLVREGAPTLWRRVATDGSYASAGDPRVLFGLGPADAAPPRLTALRVLWPDGTAEELEPPRPGVYTEVRKGSGRAIDRVDGTGGIAGSGGSP